MIESNCKKLTLLIGPASVGKSSIVKNINRINNNIDTLSLDELATKYAKEKKIINSKQGLQDIVILFNKKPDLLFEFGIEVIDDWMRKNESHKKIILDVGSGFVSTLNAKNWVQSENSIFISIAPEIGFERFKKYRRSDISFDYYFKTQFSTTRKEIYRSCNFEVDTSNINLEETTTRVSELL